MSARLDAERLLSAAQPELPGLPPGAVLVVNRISAQLPGGVGREASPAAVQRWRAGVQAQLATRWREAARPGDGPVPAQARAVAFADWAELLACLIADFVTGQPPQWWWSAWRMPGLAALSPAVPGAERVRAAMLAATAEMPAVLELLAARRLAATAVSLLESDQALGLAAAIARRYQVGPAGELVAGASEEQGPAGGGQVDMPTGGGSARAPAGEDRAASHDAPPWATVAWEAADGRLKPAQRLLLGIALSLRRAPAMARRAEFWAQARSWWEGAFDDRSPGSAGSGETGRVRAGSSGPIVRDALSGARAAMPGSDGIPTRRIDASARAGGPGAVDPDGAEAGAHEPDAGPQAAPTAARRSASEAGGGDEADAGPSATRGELLVRSGMAGALYLINVGIFLGLYGDFMSPREPGIALDPWDFVSLMSRRLLGDGAFDRDDGLWSVLGALSGHRHPGQGFRAARVWRAPAGWLKPFDEHRGAWRWTAAGGRLRVVHPAGFVVLDVLDRGPAEAQLRRELRRYHQASVPVVRPAGSAYQPPTSGRAERPGLARWCDWVAGYIAARLGNALGVPQADHAVRLVLERPGQIRVTPSRVDVCFSLAELPVSIRLAGLDRSPGWVPAAGRHLAFHFD